MGRTIEEGKGSKHSLSSLKIYSVFSGIISSQPLPTTTTCDKKYMQTSVVGGREGVLSRVGAFIPAGFYTLYVTRFRTYKIACPHQDKRREVGLKQINSCRKVL
jgi:hypothetical protein